MSKAPPWASWPHASPRPSCAARALPPPPPETALGALLAHITGGADAETFQPMNVNFGLMPPIPGPLETRRPEESVHRPRAERLAEWLAELKVSEPA